MLMVAIAFALSLLLALASVAGLVARRSGNVLLSHSTPAGRTYFLVADHNAVRLVRQHMTATQPGIAVDARRLDRFSVTSTDGATPVVATVGQSTVKVHGHLQMKFSSVPITSGRLGVRWGAYDIPAVKGFSFTASSENVTVSYWML